MESQKICANPRRVWFQFADMAGFSGQREASRLIFENIDKRCWSPMLLRMPALERSRNGVLAWIRYAMRLIWAWCSQSRLLWDAAPLLHMNLGQTSAALVRDTLLLGLIWNLRSSCVVIISLHGSNFMEWPAQSGLARRFVRILHRAAIVTVLGERQRLRLVDLGLSVDRVRIVPNTCAVVPLAEAEVGSKQAAVGPIRVLFLSSLIDTKGYPEFLEALLRLSHEGDLSIEAVLCGPMAASQFSERFPAEVDARRWIEAMVAQINKSSRVRVCWVPGASGDAKWALYRSAQIFVLPSRYRVEAQPIVLLEAMAHGCAIACSTVGEIRAILSEHEARFFEVCDELSVACEITRLAKDHELRRSLALAGWARFGRDFSLSRYVDRWDSMLKEVDSGL